MQPDFVPVRADDRRLRQSADTAKGGWGLVVVIAKDDPFDDVEVRLFRDAGTGDDLFCLGRGEEAASIDPVEERAMADVITEAVDPPAVGDRPGEHPPQTSGQVDSELAEAGREQGRERGDPWASIAPFELQGELVGVVKTSNEDHRDPVELA